MYLDFFTLEEYLEENNLLNDFMNTSEEEINQNKGLKSILNGILFKYWPNLTVPEILNYIYLFEIVNLFRARTIAVSALLKSISSLDFKRS